MATTQDYLEQLQQDRTDMIANLQNQGATLTGNETFTDLATVQIPKEKPFSYVNDGLVAWFEPIDGFDSQEHLNSRVGNDYLYVFYRTLGNSTTNPATNYEHSLVSNGNFVYTSSTDYYRTGYTIEVVATLSGSNDGGSNSTGGWVVTGDCTATAGIGAQQSYTNIKFINDSNVSANFTYKQNKPFSASVHFKNIGTYRETPVAYTVLGSVNGADYRTYNSASKDRTAQHSRTLFLSYYMLQYRAVGSIKCIRVYNRELTNAEMKANYAVDKERFGIED